MTNDFQAEMTQRIQNAIEGAYQSVTISKNWSREEALDALVKQAKRIVFLEVEKDHYGDSTPPVWLIDEDVLTHHTDVAAMIIARDKRTDVDYIWQDVLWEFVEPELRRTFDFTRLQVSAYNCDCKWCRYGAFLSAYKLDDDFNGYVDSYWMPLTWEPVYDEYFPITDCVKHAHGLLKCLTVFAYGWPESKPIHMAREDDHFKCFMSVKYGDFIGEGTHAIDALENCIIKKFRKMPVKDRHKLLERMEPLTNSLIVLKELGLDHVLPLREDIIRIQKDKGIGIYKHL